MYENFYDLYLQEYEKNIKLEKENKALKIQIKSLTARIKYLEDNQDKIITNKLNQQVKTLSKAFEDKISSLEYQVDHLRSILNNDSTNSGIPTSSSPINKNKHIPNTRIKSDKQKGGLLNHVKHSLERFNDDEVNEYIDYQISNCSKCGSDTTSLLKPVVKDELDFKIVVKKIRHRFYESKCLSCNHIDKIKIPSNLKQDNQ